MTTAQWTGMHTAEFIPSWSNLRFYFITFKNLTIYVRRILPLCFAVLFKLHFILDYDLPVSYSSNVIPRVLGQPTWSRTRFILLTRANNFFGSELCRTVCDEDKTKKQIRSWWLPSPAQSIYSVKIYLFIKILEV